MPVTSMLCDVRRAGVTAGQQGTPPLCCATCDKVLKEAKAARWWQITPSGCAGAVSAAPPGCRRRTGNRPLAGSWAGSALRRRCQPSRAPCYAIPQTASGQPAHVVVKTVSTQIAVETEVCHQLLQPVASCDDSSGRIAERTAMMSSASRCAARRMASRSRRPTGSKPVAHGSWHALQPADMTQYTRAGIRAGSCCKGKHPERLTSPLLCCRMRGKPRCRCQGRPSSRTMVRADAAAIPEVLPADGQQRHSRQQPGDRHQAGRLPASGTLGAPGIHFRWSYNWCPLCVHVRHPAQFVVGDWPGCFTSASLADGFAKHWCGPVLDDAWVHIRSRDAYSGLEVEGAKCFIILSEVHCLDGSRRCKPTSR